MMAIGQIQIHSEILMCLIICICSAPVQLRWLRPSGRRSGTCGDSASRLRADGERPSLEAGEETVQSALPRQPLLLHTCRLSEYLLIMFDTENICCKENMNLCSQPVQICLLRFPRFVQMVNVKINLFAYAIGYRQI